jgi:hypothetical protein
MFSAPTLQEEIVIETIFKIFFIKMTTEEYIIFF